MPKPAKPAAPAAPVTGVLPFSLPPPGLLPVVSVTLPVNPVARLPKESYAVTSTAGVMAAPAGVSVGCTVNTSWDAAAGETVKVRLVPPRSPAEETTIVEPALTLSIHKLGQVS